MLGNGTEVVNGTVIIACTEGGRRLEAVEEGAAAPLTSAAIVDDFLSTRPDYRAALDARTIEIMTEMMEHSQHFGLPASAQGNRASAKTMASKNWEGQPTI